MRDEQVELEQVGALDPRQALDLHAFAGNPHGLAGLPQPQCAQDLDSAREIVRANDQIDVLGRARRGVDRHGQATRKRIGDARLIEGIDRAHEFAIEVNHGPSGLVALPAIRTIRRSRRWSPR